MNQVELIEALRAFAEEREWDQFHTPKNLAMALAVEASELVEIFQWLTPEESALIMENADEAAAVREELADVYAYLLRIADITGISLDEALESKMALNAKRYPTELARGNARKQPRSRGSSRAD